MKRWRKALALALCLVLALALPTGAGAANETVEHAYALNDLGLFLGTDSGFELDKRPTRLEGLTMFVRLLGGEREAVERSYAHPFTDVPGWGDPYVGYAWEKGLTKGTGKGLFGSTAYITLEEYVTFVLRALGYDDSQGDFTWKTSVDKAVEIGLLTREQAERFLGEATSRGTMVDVSYAALTQTFKGSEQTLTEKLVDEGVFTRELAIQKGLWTAQTPDPTPSPTESVKPTETPKPTESPKPVESQRPEPTPTPAPSQPPVENQGGKYALITDVDSSGATVGDEMKPMQVAILLTDGIERTYYVHKDSTYSGTKLIREVTDQQGLLAPGGLIEYSLVENKLLIKSIANQAGNTGTVSYGNKIWNRDTQYLNYGTGTAAAAADAVVFMRINENAHAYGLKDLPDLYGDTQSNTNVQYFKNAAGKIIVASWTSSKRPKAAADTLYGIVTSVDGRVADPTDKGNTVWAYKIAVGRDEDIRVFVDEATASLKAKDIVKFDEKVSMVYERGDFAKFAATANVGEGLSAPVAIKNYDSKVNLLTFYTATSRTDINSAFEGTGTVGAKTVAKDVKILYVNAKDGKAGEDIGISAFNPDNGYANAVYHLDSDGLVDVIIIESSREKNILANETLPGFGTEDRTP